MPGGTEQVDAALVELVAHPREVVYRWWMVPSPSRAKTETRRRLLYPRRFSTHADLEGAGPQRDQVEAVR